MRHRWLCAVARGLCPAECFGIADQNDGERAGNELLEDRGIKLTQGKAGQARWKMTDHADTGRLAAKQADEGRTRGRNHQGRGSAPREVSKQQHGGEAE
jgi:hypothetical protein